MVQVKLVQGTEESEDESTDEEGGELIPVMKKGRELSPVMKKW